MHARCGRGDSERACGATSILTAVSDEEFASVGTDAVAASLRADAAIVTEPTELQVAIAHRGFVHLEIETHGRAAHGSRPHLGIDAIAKMGRVLVGIEELDARLRASADALRTSGAGACTRRSSRVVRSTRVIRLGACSRPSGGRFRARRSRSPSEELARIRSSGEGDPDFSADVRALASREPFEVARGRRGRRNTPRDARQRCWAPSRIVGVSFWADSALLAERGDPDRPLRAAGRRCPRRGRVGRRRRPRALRRDLRQRRDRNLPMSSADHLIQRPAISPLLLNPASCG